MQSIVCRGGEKCFYTLIEGLPRQRLLLRATRYNVVYQTAPDVNLDIVRNFDHNRVWVNVPDNSTNQSPCGHDPIPRKKMLCHPSKRTRPTLLGPDQNQIAGAPARMRAVALLTNDDVLETSPFGLSLGHRVAAFCPLSGVKRASSGHGRNGRR